MSEMSVQLYTVREALEQDFDGTLARIAGFGSPRLSRSRSQVRRIAQRAGPNGLTAPTHTSTCWVKIRMHLCAGGQARHPDDH